MPCHLLYYISLQDEEDLEALQGEADDVGAGKVADEDFGFGMGMGQDQMPAAPAGVAGTVMPSAPAGLVQVNPAEDEEEAALRALEAEMAM